jgi:hypothetical protein
MHNGEKLTKVAFGMSLKIASGLLQE